MFQNELAIIRRTQFLAILAVAAGIVAVSLMTVKSFVLNRWADNRENVACVPADVEYTHPYVYRQSFINVVDNDARLKTFVEQFVHLTQDETNINYQSLTTADRYDSAKLSKSKWRAIEMASGLAKADLMRSYGDSHELYKLIEETGVTWKFLIDDIIISSVPTGGPILAVVHGKYQVTYDKAKIDLPHKLWGYKEIRLILAQGSPTKDAKGNYLNKTGIFVNWFQVEDISPDVYEKITTSPADSYLKQDE